MHFCTWSTTWVSGTIPSGNEWPSWSDMANIVNYCTFNYGACTGFGRIYTFLINVHDWSHIYCFTNQTLCKIGWRTNYATQTGNWYRTFSIKPMCFILSIFCTKGNCKCCHKDVKYASSATKGFSGYLRCNSTTPKNGTSSKYLVHGK